MEILWYLHRGIGVKANLHYTEDKPWVARYNCLFYCVQELPFLVVHGGELPYKTKDCAWWLLACLSVDWPLTSSKFGVLKLHSTIFHHRLKIAARYQIFTLMEYTCFMNCQHCFLTECSFNKKVPLLQSCFFIRWDNLRHFFAETLRSFFCWDILVICLTGVSKLATTVFISLYILTFWLKLLNFFQSFQKHFSLWPKKTAAELEAFLITNISCWVLVINWAVQDAKLLNTENMFPCRMTV